MNSITIILKTKAIRDYPLNDPQDMDYPNKIGSIGPVIADHPVPCFITHQEVQFYFEGGMFAINKAFAAKILEMIVESNFAPVYRDGKKGIMVFHEIDEDRSTVEVTHFKQ
jgi:hypothetical protein